MTLPRPPGPPVLLNPDMQQPQVLPIPSLRPQGLLPTTQPGISLPQQPLPCPVAFPTVKAQSSPIQPTKTSPNVNQNLLTVTTTAENGRLIVGTLSPRKTTLIFILNRKFELAKVLAVCNGNRIRQDIFNYKLKLTLVLEVWFPLPIRGRSETTFANNPDF